MTWRARWRGVVCEDDDVGYKDEDEICLYSYINHCCNHCLMQQKGKDLFLDVADGGNDGDLSYDYDDVG